MKARDALLCWTPRGPVTVVPWPDESNLSDAYDRTGLACWTWFRQTTPSIRRCHVWVEAMHLIVRDGCDPHAVHAALLTIDEYRDCCANDMPHPKK